MPIRSYALAYPFRVTNPLPSLFSVEKRCSKRNFGLLSARSGKLFQMIGKNISSSRLESLLFCFQHCWMFFRMNDLLVNEFSECNSLFSCSPWPFMQRRHLDQLLHSKHSCSDIFCQSNRADADVLPCKRILLLKVKVFTKSYRIQLHKKLSHIRSSFRVETSIVRDISAFPTSLKKDKNVARYQCRVD